MKKIAEPQAKLDVTCPIDNGVFNFRVGAIIIQDNKVLMVKNDHDPYYYSVGGRVKIFETLEDAIVREVYEETGMMFEIDRLVWIHENFFDAAFGKRSGKRYHELSFYYLMKPQPDIAIIDGGYTSDGAQEKLYWLSIDELSDKHLFPIMFKSGLRDLPKQPMQIITSK